MQQAIAAFGGVRAAWLASLFQDWVEAERGRFVPWLAVCMGAGVVTYFDLLAEPNVWAGAAAVLIALLACIAAWRAPVGRAVALAGLAAALGFLGLGAQPPTPEWGTMLADALQFYQRAWWLLAFPGIAILVTVMAFNLLGDGLRDALDPKLRR